MRQVRYGVAMSLDGYIAGPKGEADWIIMDPDMDFAETFRRFDTLLIGRKTFEAMKAMGGRVGMGVDVRSIVVSRTMNQNDYSDLEIVSDVIPFVADLKTKPGKDIWLWGGGELFRSLLDAQLVDGVDVGMMPVLLGGGVPLLPSPAPSAMLRLKSHRVFEKSGIVGLEFDIVSPGSSVA